MGMSASQARLIQLEARQSNLEYQGQQINQERSILSQQCTDLYNSLLAMTVPTPPSTQDFTTVQYTGVDGASTFTLGSVTPDAAGTYNVELKYEKTGNCVSNYGRMNVSTYDEPESIKCKSTSELNRPIATVKGFKFNYANEITEANKDQYTDNTPVMHSVETAPNDYSGKYYYIGDGGKFVEAKDFDDAQKNGNGMAFIATTVGEVNSKYSNQNGTDGANDFNQGDDYVYSTDDAFSYNTGGYTMQELLSFKFYDKSGNEVSIKDLGLTSPGKSDSGEDLYNLPSNLYIADADGSTPIPNKKWDSNLAAKGMLIDGKYEILDFNEDNIGSSYYDKAFEAIANSYPEYKELDENGNLTDSAKDKIAKAFKVVNMPNSNGTNVPYFVPASQIDKITNKADNGQGLVDLQEIITNGKYTASEQTEGCQLVFDTSGRITKISIPVYKNGVATNTYNTITLEASKTTDEAAYKDAYAKYEYAMYEYDKKQQEINAKTEIIQQEDRNLELKLTRLDNERQQITTEIEAVQKVIDDNIEASYKTFSG